MLKNCRKQVKSVKGFIVILGSPVPSLEGSSGYFYVVNTSIRLGGLELVSSDAMDGRNARM